MYLVSIHGQRMMQRLFFCCLNQQFDHICTFIIMRPIRKQRKADRRVMFCNDGAHGGFLYNQMRTELVL